MRTHKVDGRNTIGEDGFALQLGNRLHGDQIKRNQNYDRQPEQESVSRLPGFEIERATTF
jgi:hypothetical protein